MLLQLTQSTVKIYLWYSYFRMFLISKDDRYIYKSEWVMNITDTPLSLIDFTVYSMMEIVIEVLVALFWVVVIVLLRSTTLKECLFSFLHPIRDDLWPLRVSCRAVRLR